MKSSFFAHWVKNIISALILCLSIVNVKGQQSILDRHLSIEVQGETLKTVLETITLQTTAQFVYDRRTIPLSQLVDLKMNNQRLKTVLDKLFLDSNIEYQTFQGQISLYKKKSAKFTLSGYIKDKSSGEALIGANIYETTNYIGTSSNEYGFFSLTLPEGKHEIVWSFIGFQENRDTINLFSNVLKGVYLKRGNQLKEIVVVPSDSIVQSINKPTLDFGETLSSEIANEEAEKLPSLMGENDVLKLFTYYPGVQSANEGANGISVRGGGPDQNLVLLDGVPIYNAYHLFGFVSVFNSNAINNARIYKSGFPAKYGGRLSSIMDIRMREGNMKQFHGGLNLGPISGNLYFEGPIIKNKSSFLITTRRTWLDIIARTIINRGNLGLKAGYGFYDVNFKFNYKVNDRHRLFASVFNGRDNFFRDTNPNPISSISSKEENKQKWGNTIVALRWNSIISPKLFSNTTATFSHFFNQIKNYYSPNPYVFLPEDQIFFDFSSNSKISEFGLKIDFDYRPTNKQLIRFGWGYSLHRYLPSASSNTIQNSGTTTVTDNSSPEVYSNDFYVYAENKISLSKKISFHPGIHLSGYFLSDAFYLQPQPRLLLTYDINNAHQINTSYSRMVQSVHLLTDSGIGFPTDLWVPSTRKVAPEYSDQLSLGYHLKLKHGFKIKVEGFVKKSNNLVEYEEGANFFNSNTDWENRVSTGEGRSYGSEFMLERKKGRTTGWIAYTASRTTRKFPDLNKGKKFPYRFDRNHDISVVVNHKFGPKFDIGAVWVYATGNAVSLSLEHYASLSSQTGFLTNFPTLPSNEILYFEERNNFRMDPSHRLDISFNFHKKKRLVDRTWAVGVYNVYAQDNPYNLYAKKVEEDGKQVVKIYQTSILSSPLPYFMYQIKF